jgi:hypothetical protein
MSPIPQACKPLRPKLGWNGKKIPVEVCENLIYSMPQRIAHVLERSNMQHKHTECPQIDAEFNRVLQNSSKQDNVHIE